MKNKRTILRQLLLNILVPVTAVFLLVFLFTYRYNVAKLEENTARQRRSIVEETRNLITYFDYSLRVHEETFIERMQTVSDTLVNFYLENEPHPEDLDLYRISKEIGLDTSNQHIYLISRDQIVVNTTFPPDYKLNFAKISPTFGVFLNEIYKDGEFREDRFGEEMKTGRIKKYSFQPTSDNKYIVELGFYSDEATQFRKLLLEKIHSMSGRYPGIENVNLYLGTKGIVEVELDKRLTKKYLKCLETGKNQHQELDDPATSETEAADLIYLDVLDAQLYDGYVLEIMGNNSQERRLLFDLIIYFGSLFLSGFIVLLIVIYIRARILTRPIKLLSDKTQEISTENLNNRLDISGSKELEQLSGNFNSMMEKLRLSYEGLEEKVRERTAELHTQKELVEQKNEEIIDSINYARFIQRAILPPISEITASFPESFVYYQPKDIIAGDFYWFERKEDVSWIAVGDCTGHGVPGAMVSVLCINALNQVLLEGKASSTGELLDQVRDSILRVLTKDSQSVKDGMDISVACYDHNAGSLSWSGANNPLWIFRKDGSCEIVPADKQPVGQFEGAKPFNTQQIDLQKDDLLLFFTDGFADQFGGPKQKKFKYAPFRDLVSENVNLPMTELHDLLETTFNNWKGSTEQTDDVCVVGIRFN